MTTVAGARASYRRALTDRVTIRRYTGKSGARVWFAAENVPARVTGYTEQVIGLDLQQGDQKVILDAEFLEAHQWPVPPRKGDEIYIGDRRTTVQSVDPNSRRIGDAVIAYEVQVRGV